MASGSSSNQTSKRLGLKACLIKLCNMTNIRPNQELTFELELSCLLCEKTTLVEVEMKDEDPHQGKFQITEKNFKCGNKKCKQSGQICKSTENPPNEEYWLMMHLCGEFKNQRFDATVSEYDIMWYADTINPKGMYGFIFDTDEYGNWKMDNKTYVEVFGNTTRAEYPKVKGLFLSVQEI